MIGAQGSYYSSPRSKSECGCELEGLAAAGPRVTVHKPRDSSAWHVLWCESSSHARCPLRMLGVLAGGALCRRLRSQAFMHNGGSYYSRETGRMTRSPCFLELEIRRVLVRSSVPGFVLACHATSSHTVVWGATHR